MSEENKQAARRLIEEAFGAGNFDVVDELVDPGYVGHDPTLPEPIRGPQGVKELAQGYRAAFPDMRLTVEEQLADGDQVTTRWTARGTHQGELFGVAPSGKQVTIEGISIDRFSGGKFVESYDLWDALGLMQQIGAVPQLAQA
jgi:steroid delta-isomerase-like uncharacterized protein